MSPGEWSSLRVQRAFWGSSKVVRAEADVAGRVVVLEGPEGLLGVLEGREGRGGLDEEDGADDDGPEGLERRLLERDVRRRVDVAAEERVELLREREADGREHGDAGVLNLRLLDVLDEARELLLREGLAEGVGEAAGRRDAEVGARHGVERVRDRRGGGGLGLAEGEGRAGRE